MKFSNFAKILASGLLFVSANVSAGLISIGGDTVLATIPDGGENDILDDISSGTTLQGYYGAELSVSSDVQVFVEFIGFEAGFDNDFNWDGWEMFTTEDPSFGGSNDVNPAGLSNLTVASTGLLPFSFDYNNDTGTVSNLGDNPKDNATGNPPNYFVSCETPGVTDTDTTSSPTSCDVITIWLDDGGATNDDNHDDFVIRITASEVPEPSLLGLIGLGLLGIGLVRNRRKI